MWTAIVSQKQQNSAISLSPPFPSRFVHWKKELGVELIHREKRKFSLTPAGEYFYSQSKGILDEVETIRKETIRIGQDDESELRIGYLRGYSGQELYQAVAEFSQLYPETAISIVNGTHEELYDLLRFGGVDLILSDQRRAFSEQYANYQLLQCAVTRKYPCGIRPVSRR